MATQTTSHSPLPPLMHDSAMQKVRLMPIRGTEPKYHWALGRRLDDHPGLSDLGL